jgi:hypothetical protein
MGTPSAGKASAVFLTKTERWPNPRERKTEKQENGAGRGSLIFQIFRGDGTLFPGGKQYGLFHDVLRIGVETVGVAVGTHGSGQGHDGAAGFANLEVPGTVNNQFGFIQAGLLHGRGK